MINSLIALVLFGHGGNARMHGSINGIPNKNIPID
jgi:hypothetical protein